MRQKRGKRRGYWGKGVVSECPEVGRARDRDSSKWASSRLVKSFLTMGMRYAVPGTCKHGPRKAR
eukprot:scaffold268340_cov37-Tisochrysis_lutea.AAC.1